MQLQLNDGYVRPRARLDNLFLLKREIVRVCLTFAEWKQRGPKVIPLLQHHPTQVVVQSYIRQHYYNLLHTQNFDKRVYDLLTAEAIQERDGYYLMQFSEDILRRLRQFRNQPKQYSPPIVYENNNYRGKIISLYTDKFWGRVEEDIFGHKTLIYRRSGQEKYFSVMITETDSYPIFVQPFLVTSRDIPALFDRYNTTFDDMFNLLKGLFNLWHGFRF